ncbi:ankyrin repeat domain-containing protein [Halarcobacter anaerophilus]|uniref:ankyrin repeat domain-containing protein n=1 Tax=Halarcobacter anaerophilus TaxID=877500 RepID=UPI0005C8A242|nr:ankyrin repeat domain-containing protein [Halarcobacter anaerophilus]
MEVLLTKDEEQRYEQLQHMALNFARSGETKTLKSMISAGINVNLSDEKGNSLLMLASYNKNYNCTKMLLEQKADIDKRNDRGQTPLGGVCFKGDLNLVKLLLSYGADIDSDNGGGRTPLMFAAMFGHKEIVDFLIQKGADTNSQTFFCMSAFTLAKITGGIRNLF